MKGLKLILLTATLLIGMSAQAQLIPVPFSIGIKGGVNNSTFSGDVEDINSRAGFNAGLTARFNLPANFYAGAGIEITTKGAKFDGGRKASPMYLQIPANLGYRISLGLPATLRVQAGPYWAYGLGGKIEGADGSKSDFFGDNSYKKNDFGLGAAVGLDFLMFGVDVGYDFGLTNISQNSDIKVRNRNAYISFSYRFM